MVVVAVVVVVIVAVVVVVVVVVVAVILGWTLSWLSGSVAAIKLIEVLLARGVMHVMIEITARISMSRRNYLIAAFNDYYRKPDG